jgi:WD40 repeat protein/serine/threonine protein kinase
VTERRDPTASLERLGRYELLGDIGHGAFADVIRAWDDALACHVAIKVLNQTAAQDPILRNRFIEEGQLLRRVHSDHVIAVHDVGESAEGRPFLVLDLAEGGTLADRLDQHGKRATDADSVHRIVESIAMGLDALHQAGIIHRDIKPENLLIRAIAGDATVVRTGLIAEGERLVIGDLGLAKDLEERGSAPSVIGGSTGYQAPEQLRRDGVIGPSSDLYAASAVLWSLVSGDPAPEAHDVELFLPALPSEWQRFFARAMHMDPAQRYPSAISWCSAALDHLELEPTTIDAKGIDRDVHPSGLCPYKGLAAFESEDAECFFGREALVGDLVERLHLHRVLVIAGPSGSGKSSLLRAGLIPALRSGALPGSDAWNIDLMTPGWQPFRELHYRLSRWAGDDVGPERVSAVDLRNDPSLARRLMDDARSTGRDGDQVRVLCVDQFEEVFTQAEAHDDGAAHAFVDALAAMADPVDSNLRVVLAVRADFYALCAQVGWLAERITTNQVLVGPMAREDMRRAVEEPARRAGLRLGQGLIDAVLDEGGQSAGSLPLISHALMETWKRRSGNTLNTEAFRQAGGVAGAIAKSAEDLYVMSIGEPQQAVAKRLLLRLVTPGDGAADTRRAMPLAELERDSDPIAMRSVVDAFVNARLLSVDDKSAQIAHEALLGSWPRLRSWIDAERENLRTHQRIRRAALEWEGSGHDSDLFFRGARLATTEEWFDHNRDQLDRLEARFVSESIGARKAAEEQREAIDARSHRNRRRATLALACLAAASVLASVIAFAAFRDARRNAEQAEQNFATALGTSALGQAQPDPVRSLLLAVESIERTGSPTTDARSALVQARLALAGGGVVPIGPAVSTPGSFRVALRPDGRIAAVADSTGPIRLYDTQTGSQIGSLLDAHSSGPRSLDFTTDGGVLVSGSSDGLVLRWDLTTPEKVPNPEVLFDSDDIVWAIDVSPDDRSVMVASDAGRLHELDLASGEQTRLLEWTGSAGIVSVAYSPEGDHIVASNRDGRLQSWSTTSDEQRWDATATPSGPNLWEIVFSPDGRRFVTAGDRDVAMMHDAETGQVIDGATFGTPGGAGATSQVHGIALTADGRLIGGTIDGDVHTWSVDDPTVVTTSAARHSDAVEHGDLSADGSTYVSVGDDKRLRVWRVVSDTSSSDFAGFPNGAFGVAFDPSGQRMVIGDGDGSVHLVDRTTGSQTAMKFAHDGPVIDVAWSHDGATIATIGRDALVMLWDSSTGTTLDEFAMIGGSDGSVEFSPDDRFLVATEARDGEAGLVRIWDLGERSLVADLPDHRQGARTASFSVDGEWLATADGAGTIQLWETDDFSWVRSWQASEGADVVAALDFSADGLLASVDSSEDVRVWDPSSGKQVGVTVSGLDTGGARGVGFTHDGTSLAVLNRSGDLHLVDWDRGENLSAQPIPAHSGDVNSWDLDFTPDGETFATVGPDGLVKVWDLLSVDAACAAAGRSLDMTLDSDIIEDIEPIGCPQ